MLKKTITYVDYDGNERTEDFWFHLTNAELTAMNLSAEGGLEATINKIAKELNGKRIVEMFQNLILSSYGEKSLDGRRFIKNAQLSEEFAQTEAYSQLFMELSTDAEAGAAFINGLVEKVSKNENNVVIHPALK